MKALKVKGMTCQHCVLAVQKSLNSLDGVRNVEVDLTKGEVLFENSKNVSEEKILEAIENAGFQVDST